MKPPVQLLPQEGTQVRFVTNFTISQDVAKHGIDGVFKGGKFWSTDLADHWAPREVTRWEMKP